MWRNDRIIVTQSDLERLRAILGSPGKSARDTRHLLDLSDELDRAQVVPEREMPSDVVTLQSQVRVRDRKTGMASNYTVVTPAQADVSSGHVSVLAPLGTALLGYREGDEVEWQMPGGVRQLWIERVMQPQPLSADRGEHCYGCSLSARPGSRPLATAERVICRAGRPALVVNRDATGPYDG